MGKLCNTCGELLAAEELEELDIICNSCHELSDKTKNEPMTDKEHARLKAVRRADCFKHFSVSKANKVISPDFNKRGRSLRVR